MHNDEEKCIREKRINLLVFSECDTSKVSRRMLSNIQDFNNVMFLVSNRYKALSIDQNTF